MALELNGTTGVSLIQDGAITIGKLPAGSVVKVSTYENNTYTDVTSSGFTTVWTFSYTPTAAGNLLIIQICPELFTYRSGGADSRYSSRVLIDSTYYPGSTNTFLNNGFYDYGGSGSQLGTKQLYQFYYTATSTSAFNISLQLAANGQTQGVRLNNSASGVTLNQCSTAVVTEISV